MKQAVKKTVIVLIWIAIWQLLAVAISNPVLLAGPYETVVALVSMLPTEEFLSSVANTMIRIVLGFLSGGVLGFLLALAAYKAGLFEDFIKPLFTVIKSIPVASFIIIILLWAGSSYVAYFICAFIAMPILFFNVLTGLKACSRELLQMADVFGMSFKRRIRYLFLPALKPHLKSAISLACGMSFRAGIAAEVIGQPLRSVGNGLYRAKIHLMTAEMFAWTLVAVVLAYLLELAVARLLRRFL